MTSHNVHFHSLESHYLSPPAPAFQVKYLRFLSMCCTAKLLLLLSLCSSLRALCSWDRRYVDLESAKQTDTRVWYNLTHHGISGRHSVSVLARRGTIVANGGECGKSCTHLIISAFDDESESCKHAKETSFWGARLTNVFVRSY